jgi:alkanesulfonate monooxygenase SsuD/methylene tetrahydromethanopterin reductase-like flavin-dependent oxidoreductase (luciferase family)
LFVEECELMAIKLGVHTGPQNLSMTDLHRIWKRADEAGFHWISVWDHFYANPLTERSAPCFEAVASMASLASLTSRVRRLHDVLYVVPQSGPAGQIRRHY